MKSTVININFALFSRVSKYEWTSKIESELEKNTLGAQSFTSLMANLRQDINEISSFSKSLNGTFHIGILSQMRRVTNTNILL